MLNAVLIVLVLVTTALYVAMRLLADSSERVLVRLPVRVRTEEADLAGWPILVTW